MSDETQKRRIARLVASAIHGGVWFGVSTTRKVGVVLFVIGWIAIPFGLANLAPGRLFWFIAAFACVGIGSALAYAGMGARSYTADGPDNISHIPYVPPAEGSADGGSD